MRMIVTVSGMLVMAVYIIIIQSVITSNSIRSNELMHSTDVAMDYAYDKLCEYYGKPDYSISTEASLMNEDEYSKWVMSRYCQEFSKTVKSDSTFYIELITLDFDTGIFQVRVREEYDNPISRYGKKSIFYEKTYILV